MIHCEKAYLSNLKHHKIYFANRLTEKHCDDYNVQGMTLYMMMMMMIFMSKNDNSTKGLLNSESTSSVPNCMSFLCPFNQK